VAGRVGEDPEALAAGVQPGRAQLLAAISPSAIVAASGTTALLRSRGGLQTRVLRPAHDRRLIVLDPAGSVIGVAGRVRLRPDCRGGRAIREGASVTLNWSADRADGRSREAPSGIDTSVAHPARVYDYWLGGKDHFAADRKAAEEVIAANPSILPDVRANRGFLGRAVRYLAGEAGIRQFLDLGTGLPAADNTHEVAQAVAPESRIVYVDKDPIVLVHARALLTSTAEGATSYVEADLRDPDKILAAAAELLDFDRPVAIMLLAILQFIPDSDDPYGIVARLLAAVPSGSYLAVSHPAKDIKAETVAAATARYNARVATQMTRRTHAEVGRFFAGLDLVEPGLVQPHRWRPDPVQPATSAEVSAHAGVGRKP
jgi:hypothetical protein